MALSGICSPENFGKEMELPSTLDELGVEDGVIGKIARMIFSMGANYERLTEEEVLEILRG